MSCGTGWSSKVGGKQCGQVFKPSVDIRQQVPHWWSSLIRASGSSHPLAQRLRDARVIVEVLSREPKIWVPTKKEISVARAEYEGDKFARSAVGICEVKVVLVAQKERENTVCGGLPSHSGASAAPGGPLEESWIQVCRCLVECCEESAHSVGAPLDRCTGFGDQGKANGLVKEALDLPRSVVLSDMQKSANLSISGNPLCTDGAMWPREGALCGCWWGNARDRVVGSQSYVGHVPGWSRLRTVCFSICLCPRRTK